MDEDEEINILSDPDFLNCDYTVHPQWLLDKPSTNPDCWYNSTSAYRGCEESDPIGHITTENSITDESGWTEKEKTLLERGIEIFGKSPLRLSQFIGTKTASDVKYYFKNFFMELHPTHSTTKSIRKLSEDFTDIGNILIDSQIPCTGEQVVVNDLEIGKGKRKRINNTGKDGVKNKTRITSPKQRNSKFNIVQNKLSGKSRNLTIFNANNSNSLPDTRIIQSNIKSLEGEIVYIKRNADSSESDVEVDIEDDCDNVETSLESKPIKIPQMKIEATEKSHSIGNTENRGDDENVSNQLSSLDIPRYEVVLDKNSTSSLEKLIFSEFFMGSSEKSIEEYLNLRNHVILQWNSKKPNYLTKADIQKGFKSSIKGTLCKIHNFLEQIGVINYGCGRVRYIRPMHKIFKNAKIEDLSKNSSQPKRFKKKFLHNGEGGCTVSHGAHGEIIDTTVINEDPIHPKLKPMKKIPTYLIYCKPFLKEYKFKVKLNLLTLLLMDFHAHSSLSEVMGLIGGTWNQNTKTLLISHYEPCKNLASSTTHCDMCPVSQSESAERINGMNMNLLGWFHSHPTFAPEPSQQDLDTQRQFQEWIGHGKPCVGVILSPFNRPTALTPSEYRCLIVDKLDSDDRILPYKFKVDVVFNHFDMESFVDNIVRIKNFIVLNGENQDEKLRINFNQPYMHDRTITFLEKFVSSARLTLERYFSEQLCQKIVKRIISIFGDEGT